MLRIVRVLAPNPGPFTLEGTNTWIVGEGPAAVIDPGPEDERHLAAVAGEAGPVAAILLSHQHPDHAPGAALLARATGAPVLAFRPRAGQKRLGEGVVIDVGGARLRAAHTPGHSPDSVVFVAEGTGALFTGDSVLGRGTSIVDPPEGDLAAYLRSLARMRELKPRVIYPGHGPTVFDALGKLDEYVAHREMRERQVLVGLGEGPSGPADLVPSIYQDVPTALHPAAERQVLAHLLKLEAEGRVVRSGRGQSARFELARERRCERCGRPAAGRSRLCRRCSLDVLQEHPSPTRPAKG